VPDGVFDAIVDDQEIRWTMNLHTLHGAARANRHRDVQPARAQSPITLRRSLVAGLEAILMLLVPHDLGDLQLRNRLDLAAGRAGTRATGLVSLDWDDRTLGAMG
jgi:hypothetical protein